MKNFALGLALAAALISTIALSSPAQAQDSKATAPQTGHYEWRDAPAVGQKQAPYRLRVWVGPKMETASAEAKCKPQRAGVAGRYEWQSNPRQQRGPRAPLLAPVRVWVPAC